MTRKLSTENLETDRAEKELKKLNIFGSLNIITVFVTLLKRSSVLTKLVIIVL